MVPISAGITSDCRADAIIELPVADETGINRHIFKRHGTRECFFAAYGSEECSCAGGKTGCPHERAGNSQTIRSHRHCSPHIQILRLYSSARRKGGASPDEEFVRVFQG